MIESSQGGAEVVSSEFRLYRILCFARAKGGARAPCLDTPLGGGGGGGEQCWEPKFCSSP